MMLDRRTLARIDRALADLDRAERLGAAVASTAVGLGALFGAWRLWRLVLGDGARL